MTNVQNAEATLSRELFEVTMVKGAYGPIKQITLEPSRCSRINNAATVGRLGQALDG